MKIRSNLIALLLPLVLATGVAAAGATESAAPAQPWGLKDLPKLATPRGLVDFTRDEISSERDDLRHEVADLRAGKPKAIVELSFTGARLAGASSGAVTGARLAYHFATLSTNERAERLGTALPRTLAQSPDRGFQRAVHATLRGAVTGNWNIGSAVANDLGGQALDLAPAALNSTHDAAHKLATDLATQKS